MNPLKHPIALSRPRLIDLSGWLEHVPFGLFVVDIVRPRVLVELGTYSGVSYCSFCQAVSELSTDTHCYAVDTWLGDPHTGSYGEEVLSRLREHHDPRYGSFSHLIQSTFDDALNQFEDRSIDLLHIDGHHTYEAVNHDWQTWLPKMSDRGIILLHDINVREGDFGTWRLWQELIPLYRHFEFEHGFGLGALLVGEEEPGQISELLNADGQEIESIREFFYRLGQWVILQYERQLSENALSDLGQQVEELQSHVSQKIEELTLQAQKQIAQIEEQKAQIEDMTQHWADVQQGFAWSLVERLRGMRLIVAPRASRRERLWRAMIRRPSGPEERADPVDHAQPVFDSRTLDTLGHARLRTFLTLQQRMAFPLEAKPRVSIVILAWNQAQYTYMTLESLLGNQANVSFEVILVDNGSSDETADLLKRIEGVHIQVNPTNLGFGAACNQGARMARGDYVCLLNNDTLLTPGWLGALVHAMEENHRCGAAGARLVLPNMQLQEAGGTIWQDGSCAGHGRGENPFAPEYSFVREVDYCSAACLLLRRDVFWAVGGFDARYSPAYYEDLDLCMAIAQAGYTILYVPQATIFHVEHGSTGRTQAVRLQLRNREIFKSKWGETLSGRGLPGP